MNVTSGSMLTYHGQCVDGFASVTVFAYVGLGDFDPAKCAGCDLLDEGDTDYVSYYFKLPRFCETSKPTSSPSASPTEADHGVYLELDMEDIQGSGYVNSET